MKKTLVIGASSNPERYSNRALARLKAAGHPVVAIGARQDQAHGIEIMKEKSPIENVDTVSIYINPARQQAYYDYIMGLKPSRVIFNPGTENEELEKQLQEAGIKTMQACTLVLLSTRQF